VIPRSRIGVAQVGKLYFPHIGGVENQMRALTRQLTTSGVDVEVIVGQSERARARLDRVDTVTVNRVTTLARVVSNPVTVGLGRALKASPMDVFHLHAPFPSGELAALRTLQGRPVVITHHMDIWRQRLLLRGFAPWQRTFYRRARFILASSPQLADHSAILRANRDRVAVVPLGIDIAEWDASEGTLAAAAQLRETLGPNKQIALFVGRLVYYKDLDVLLRAIDGLDITLVIAGAGPLETVLRRQAASLSEARVVFAGTVDDKELRALYQAADLFVLPSGHPGEAFGVVLLEAAVNRLPLITSDVPTGVQHVNKHELTGLVAQARNPASFRAAIVRLINDAGLRRSLGQGARERVRAQFGIDRVASMLTEIYREAAR
jgi:glycosyltransferase involved in cell wall biosynthesis